PSTHSSRVKEANLVAVQLLIDDLAVPPARYRAELEREALVRRRMHLAIETLPGTDHLPRPVRDGAGPVARRDHDLVRVVGEMVLDRLEECLRLGLVRVAAARRVGLPRPVHRGIPRMALCGTRPSPASSTSHRVSSSVAGC